VEPDLIFFRKGNEPKSGDRNFKGVPDLLIEVIGQETRHVDEQVKMSIYGEAGIPEYWLVDPKAHTIVIYRLSEDGRRYVEWARGGEGDVVGSVALTGLQLAVSQIFPR
jgi:Uma2 family endonuclease